MESLIETADRLADDNVGTAELVLSRFRTGAEADKNNPVAQAFADVVASWLGRDPSPKDR
ncbi:MAG: hypothetical protein ABS81_07255 [Pseudonocardia sp. SCN 72-86]|nr:MAG: hypothetical protein ABS81_07255 [Pseudonocardia sp. SCN 72-86]